MIGRDERAVSIAVTHVLAIGITAVLMSGLLLGAGNMLDTQHEQSTESSLETIGERMASEIAGVDRTVGEDQDGVEDVSVETSHHRFAGESQYTVTLYEDCEEDHHPLVETERCIVLASHGEDVDVAIPIVTENELDNRSVTGGPIVIEWDDEDDVITIEEGS